MDRTDAEKFMRRAAELAREGSRAGHGGPFGAVVVREGQIVGAGFNRVVTDNDPSAHAEIVAIRHACANLKSFQLDGCEIFASGEPCPMCLAAIYWSRIGKIWYANTVQQAAEIGFDDGNFYDQLKLPSERRSIPQIHLPSSEALAAFKEWAADATRVRY